MVAATQNQGFSHLYNEFAIECQRHHPNYLTLAAGLTPLLAASQSLSLFLTAVSEMKCISHFTDCHL